MGVNIQTIKDINPFLKRELNNIYPETEIKAISNVLVRSLFKLTKVQFMSLPEYPVPHEKAAEIKKISAELKKGKPFQYVLGETCFYNCIFKVGNGILIPRPETEELTALIINDNVGFKGNILDIGTGSGCIAIALAVNLPESLVTATDISEKALDFAKENARINHAHVRFIQHDIFTTSPDFFEMTDIIVSNPPYVRESEKKDMSRNILDFEPHNALFVPDEDPLVYYRAIISLSDLKLRKEGKLYFEINEVMGNNLSSLLEKAGYREISILNDINGKNRIIRCSK